ncbi:MAG: class I SAM-dependent methyltransferase [Deltaproteobacteria bacterium]|nr:class I SAM-dependent methyltransferase [Deltaproteobacteria bacterium]
MSGEAHPTRPKWPKVLPPLTPEQQAMRDGFMRDHLEAMQTKWYGFVENFNHGYPLRTFFPGCRTLEIGAGIGSHLKWERHGEQDYHALELREDLTRTIRQRYPGVKAVTGDCQKRLPFGDGFFSRVLAIHVLEHLPDLPAALSEIHRVMAGDGLFSVLIPAEGGLANSLARAVSGRRTFERKYHQSYDWLIKSEHINLPWEIKEELDRLFVTRHRRFYPFFIPSVNLNIAIGFTLSKT